MRNEALAARRELQAHRAFVTGMTASAQTYKVVDLIGSKAWVVDVYLGPQDANPLNIIRDVLLAETARQTVSKIRQPILMERSKQGSYTVIGRSDTMPAGAQMPEGSVLEPTYHRIELNLAQLSLRFIPDISYTVEKWGDKATWDDGKAFQQINGFDAFGNQVIGDDAVDPPDLYALTPIKRTLTRHVLITKRPWGPVTDGFRWGVDPWDASLQKLVELET